MSIAHERMRSGRSIAMRMTWPPPQSWPTRSTGAPCSLELRRQPCRVLVCCGSEAVRDRGPEAGGRQGDRIGVLQLGEERSPDRSASRDCRARTRLEVCDRSGK